jgi:hypothetical protein
MIRNPGGNFKSTILFLLHRNRVEWVTLGAWFLIPRRAYTQSDKLAWLVPGHPPSAISPPADGSTLEEDRGQHDEENDIEDQISLRQVSQERIGCQNNRHGAAQAYPAGESFLPPISGGYLFFIAFTAVKGNSLKGQRRQSHPVNDGFIHLNFNLPFHQKVDPKADSANNLGSPCSSSSSRLSCHFKLIEIVINMGKPRPHSWKRKLIREEGGKEGEAHRSLINAPNSGRSGVGGFFSPKVLIRTHANVNGMDCLSG